MNKMLGPLCHGFLIWNWGQSDDLLYINELVHVSCSEQCLASCRYSIGKIVTFTLMKWIPLSIGIIRVNFQACPKETWQQEAFIRGLGV